LKIDKPTAVRQRQPEGRTQTRNAPPFEFTLQRGAACFLPR